MPAWSTRAAPPIAKARVWLAGSLLGGYSFGSHPSPGKVTRRPNAGTHAIQVLL